MEGWIQVLVDESGGVRVADLAVEEDVEAAEDEEQDFGMKRDIDKLADRLVERGREGIVAEKKMLEWKIAEKKEQRASKTKPANCQL